ncbi:MAG: serine hydrolase [Kiritimatiellae bacterium]|nr:serine hydrolase [Kiritimatiellia bacterium]
MKKIILTVGIFLAAVFCLKADLNPISSVTNDVTCRALFLKEMARKSEELKLETAYFENASGLTPNSRITVSDLTKIALAALKEPDLARIWAETDCEIQITGPNPRKEVLVHAYKKYMKTWGDFVKQYKFLGGKGGSLFYRKPPLSTRSHVLVTEVEGQKILITFAGALFHDDAFLYDIEIINLAKAMMRGEEVVLQGLLKDFEAKGGAFEFVTLTGKKLSYSSKYVNMPHVPASTTKIVATLCLLDHVKDLSTKLTVRESDIVGGSGFKCYAGDQMTYEDAIRALMLPSSNTIANSVASNVGAMILEKRIKDIER